MQPLLLLSSHVPLPSHDLSRSAPTLDVEPLALLHQLPEGPRVHRPPTGGAPIQKRLATHVLPVTHELFDLFLELAEPVLAGGDVRCGLGAPLRPLRPRLGPCGSSRTILGRKAVEDTRIVYLVQGKDEPDACGSRLREVACHRLHAKCLRIAKETCPGLLRKAGRVKLHEVEYGVRISREDA